jgi:hypothetical protein
MGRSPWNDGAGMSITHEHTPPQAAPFPLIPDAHGSTPETHDDSHSVATAQ